MGRGEEGRRGGGEEGIDGVNIPQLEMVTRFVEVISINKQVSGVDETRQSSS